MKKLTIADYMKKIDTKVQETLKISTEKTAAEVLKELLYKDMQYIVMNNNMTKYNAYLDLMNKYLGFDN